MLCEELNKALAHHSSGTENSYVSPFHNPSRIPHRALALLRPMASIDPTDPKNNIPLLNEEKKVCPQCL
jgi:hypothetical protein